MLEQVNFNIPWLGRASRGKSMRVASVPGRAPGVRVRACQPAAS